MEDVTEKSSQLSVDLKLLSKDLHTLVLPGEKKRRGAGVGGRPGFTNRDFDTGCHFPQMYKEDIFPLKSVGVSWTSRQVC